MSNRVNVTAPSPDELARRKQDEAIEEAQKAASSAPEPAPAPKVKR